MTGKDKTSLWRSTNSAFFVRVSVRAAKPLVDPAPHRVCVACGRLSWNPTGAETCVGCQLAGIGGAKNERK